MWPDLPDLNAFQSLAVMGDEAGRLEALRALNLLDTPPEQAFDRIVQLAARHFRVPVVLLSLVDHDRLWFKAQVGHPALEMPRASSVCSLTIEHSGPLVMADTHLDPRAHRLDCVTGEENVRAYAGIPVMSAEGYAVGTLCLIDHQPRPFSAQDIEDLKHLAEIVTAELDRRRAQTQLDHLALTDPLTGLPNRAHFRQHLSQATRRVTLTGERVALCLLDLDRFKVINDTLGHETGDLLLQQVAVRLRDAVSSSDLVARMGGDEFTLVLTDVRDIQATDQILDRLQDAFRVPFVLNGQELFVAWSAGVSLYPDDGVDADEMLTRADTAMYRAKRSGQRYAYFNAQHDRRSAAEIELVSALHHARTRGELLAVYQPVVRAQDFTPVAHEALIRWRRGGTLISPAAFIPLAESSGQIHELGEFMLREAATQVQSGRLSRVSVNVSPLEFEQGDYVQRVARVLDDTGLPPDQLVLEITETSLLDADRSREVLTRLRDLGVQLALDDFGTGYSSLSALATLPVQHLKIDRSFVQDVGQDTPGGRRALDVVRSIVTLARALDLSTIAEGVETARQAQLLRDVGCTYLQGYHFGRPAPLIA
ncbi:EAL domain-containing protein [Deinococcus taeanensis]|uniref:putative bifunctional diguanylate cyclase/phosphodiesterase n=1 Tax=Deinococcus taeanensis TaxID=2737050 RepID=UPI001CDB9654|nr:EAL domain-containing protein [Deinococcus taeanensis]UBV43745.1 EAL domain-containing protein [Deinococcus taeanensis]